MTDWLSGFPTKVKIDGREHQLKTHFRNSLDTIMAYEDDDLTDWEKQEILIKNLYEKPYPENFQKAIEMGVRFLNCGMEEAPNRNSDKRLYSFKTDGRYIYSAVLVSANGIDLNKCEYMHWWEFMARLMETKETTWNHIVSIRDKRNRRVKLSKEETEFCESVGWDLIDMKKLNNSTSKKNEELEKEAAEMEKLLNG